MMTNASHLNDFQKKARREIETLVASHGKTIRTDVSGESETYLIGEIQTSDLKIWIYDDELEFKSAGKSLLLERPDFKDRDTMLHFFLEEVGKELQLSINSK